jgi:predicted  nucleic acid-binding Zn-ribbon protein
MVEANWNGYLGFGYVPRRAIGPQKSLERAAAAPDERRPRGSGRGARRPAERVERASVDVTALGLELDRTRAEVKAARAELEATRKRLLDADRALDEMGELRSRLTAASERIRALHSDLEGVQRLEAKLAASEQSEMHLQRYCDRLESRLAEARAENARLRAR